MLMGFLVEEIQMFQVSYLTYSYDKLMRAYSKGASLILSGPERVRAPKKTFCSVNDT